MLRDWSQVGFALQAANRCWVYWIEEHKYVHQGFKRPKQEDCMDRSIIYNASGFIICGLKQSSSGRKWPSIGSCISSLAAQFLHSVKDIRFLISCSHACVWQVLQELVAKLLVWESEWKRSAFRKLPSRCVQHRSIVCLLFSIHMASKVTKRASNTYSLLLRQDPHGLPNHGGPQVCNMLLSLDAYGSEVYYKGWQHK